MAGCVLFGWRYRYNQGSVVLTLLFELKESTKFLIFRRRKGLWDIVNDPPLKGRACLGKPTLTRRRTEEVTKVKVVRQR